EQTGTPFRVVFCSVRSVRSYRPGRTSERKRTMFRMFGCSLLDGPYEIAPFAYGSGRDQGLGGAFESHASGGWLIGFGDRTEIAAVTPHRFGHAQHVRRDVVVGGRRLAAADDRVLQ